MVRRLMVLVSVVGVLLGVSVAQAGAAPLAATDPVTAITGTDATVNGTLDANGGGTTVDCHFDVVDDATFQASTFDVPNQVGCNEGSAFDDGAQAVTGSLGGLVPATLYHVRLVVANATDTTFAAEQTFTTAAAAPVLESLGTSASAITATGATLTSSVNPSNADTTYHFDYGTTTAYGQSMPSPDAFLPAAFGDQPVSADIELAPGITYHYRVSADNGTGGVQHGADHTFTTAPAGAGGGIDITAATATLTGTVNPHGSAASYHFEYGTDTTYGSSTAETSAGSGASDLAVSEPVTSLLPATIYHVRAVTTDTGSGVTTAGVDGIFTTAPAPIATTADATGVSTDRATLNGTVDTHGLPGVVRFSVVSTTSAYQASTPDQALPAGAGSRTVSADLADLPPGQTYRVRLSVTSNATSSIGGGVTFSTPRPTSTLLAATLTAVGVPYGCVAPRLDAYSVRPRPGTAIGLTGVDLGVGGVVTLGGTALTSTSWTPSAVTVVLPDDAAGSLPLIVDCGTASNAIAVQLYRPPSSSFTARAKARGAALSVMVRVPGPGVLRITGSHLARRTVHVKKAGTTAAMVRLTAAAARTLRRHHALDVRALVSFTPTGGVAARRSVEATLEHKDQK